MLLCLSCVLNKNRKKLLHMFTKKINASIINIIFASIYEGAFRMDKNVIKEVLSWIAVFAVAILLAIFINRVIIFRVKVPSGSMENTIMTGDSVITFRLSYLFSNPKRGDIVVFPNPDDEEVDYIKRIVGLPGENIEGKDGLVYIDGKALDEEYVKEKINSDFGPYEIPEDSYFMMGDNRNRSLDSRGWNNKYLKKEKIRGKAILKFPDISLLR